MHAIASEALKHISEFNAQDLGISAWANAIMAVCNRPLSNAISAQSLRIMSDFSPQNISNTALSWSMLGIRDDDLMVASARAVLTKENCDRLNDHRISNESHRFLAHSLPLPLAAPSRLRGDSSGATTAFDMLFLLTLICYPLGATLM